MCIGLKVSAPEAAVADPSRLKIEEIFPTYVSCDSFLESAKFNLEAAMFKDGEGKIVEAIGGGSITGIMPLYLFPEHCHIAKRKIPPVLGLMCAHDVLGYTSE